MKLAELANAFSVKENKSNVSREIIAGVTTFAAMSYIIFLQPMIMSGRMFNLNTGMDFGALITGTCIAAAFGSILMGLLANYPIGLAPGMGENFFFVLTILPACAVLLNDKVGAAQVWQLGLGVVFLSGAIFAIISLAQIRRLVMDSISPSMKYAIAGGIGLFIALIGFENGKLITFASGHYVLTGNLLTPEIAVFMTGLIGMTILKIMKIRGAVLIGIGFGTLVAMAFGEVMIRSVIGIPPSPAPIFGKIDLLLTFELLFKLLPLIVVLTFMDLFDTMGSLIGVGAQANLLKDNKLENAGSAMSADALATVFGSVCGHSTVTSFVESGAGVEAGGRTGLTAVVVGICFLLALFFSPLVKSVAMYTPITAPALVVVGAMMMSNIAKIKWNDVSESLPAFLIIVGIPMTYSIADGMMLGFILYPLLKMASGQGKKIGFAPYLLAIVLLAYLIIFRNNM